MDNFRIYKPKQLGSRLEPEVSPKRQLIQNDGIHPELLPVPPTHLDKIRFYDSKPRQPRTPSLPYVAKFKVADLVDQRQGAAGSGDEATPHAANEAGRPARCTPRSALHRGSTHRSGNYGDAARHPVTLDKDKKAEIDVNHGRMDTTMNRGSLTADIQHIKTEETDDDAREVETSLKRESLAALDRKIVKGETDNEGKKPAKGIVDTILKSDFPTVDEDGEGEADDASTSLARESNEEDELEDDGDAQYGPMFLPEARKKRLKRCFSDMMNVIDSGIWVDQGLADILHATMEQLERVGGDIRKHKRRKHRPTL